MNYPVRKVYITQGWGENPDIYSRFGLKGHNGIDLRIFDNNGNRAVSGDLIAPHDGKIIEAYLDSKGYGWYYKIENDVEGSILGHNKELLFKVGDTVKEGQLIAYTDNTGFSTGAHVHWGYYRKPRNKADGYSGTIDPTPFILPSTQETMPEDLKKILDYYKVKTSDELIKMVDEQLKFLKDARSKIDDLNETIKFNQQKCKEMMAGYEKQIDKLKADCSSELLEQLNTSKEKIADLTIKSEQLILDVANLRQLEKDLKSGLIAYNISFSTDSNGLLTIKKVSKNIFQKLWDIFIKY